MIHSGKPRITTKIQENHSYSDVTVPGFELFAKENDYQLPGKCIVLSLPGSKAQLQIMSSQQYRIPLLHPPSIFRDTPIGPDSLLAAPEPSHPDSMLGEKRLASLTLLGQFRGNHLWSLQISPFQYDPGTRELIVYDQIVLQIVANPPAVSMNNMVPIPEDEKVALQGMDVISLQNSKWAEAANALLKKSSLNVGEKWKILVSKDGIYKVTGRDLQSAGVDLFNVEIKHLKLTVNGHDVPIYVKGWRDGQFDENDYFEFWGEYNRKTFLDKAPDLYNDPYSRTNVYWLSWEGERGQWMGEENGMIDISNSSQYYRPFSFLQTVHVEKDRYYDRLSGWQSDSLRDFWFFDTGIGAAKKMEYPFECYYPDPLSSLPVTVKVMLSGRTKDYAVPHDVSAFLNNSFIGRQNWWGQNFAAIQSEPNLPLSGTDVNHEQNTLTIVNNARSQSFDYIFLNWFEVTYPRLYRAYNDYIKFSIPPDYHSGTFIFKVDGFTHPDIDVYKLGSSKMTGVRVQETTDFEGFTSLQASFQDFITSSQTEYVAVAEDAKLKPDTIYVDRPGYLKNSTNSADYLVIAHKRFINTPALDDLVQLRQSQGYHVARVDVQDVFDEFNAGKPSPYAIKDFLRWVYHHWQAPQLKYVLLVGDGSYVRYSSRDTLDLVPIFMRQTQKFGAAASDHWYALIDGDDEIPDVHIGRLPVRTVDELQIIVSKIITYETEPPVGDWRNRILFMGGNGSVFRGQVFSLSPKVPQSFDQRRLFTFKDRILKNDPFFGGTADLLDYLDEGCALVTFHGHGGGAIWADNGLMRLEDAERIYSENKLPFVLSMTCFTASFESPSRSNLADALLFADKKGAVAFLGASGVGWIQNDFLLLREILTVMFHHPDLTLGEIIDTGKIAYFAKNRTWLARSEINQYHLLGDPATRLVLPRQQTALVLDSPLKKKGDQIDVSVHVPFDRGTAHFSLVDSLMLPVFSQEQEIQSKVATLSLPIPDDFSTASGYVRFYGYDDLGQQDVHGAAAFSLNGAVFDSAYVRSEGNDRYRFYLRLQSVENIVDIVCVTGSDTLEMVRDRANWLKSKSALKKAAFQTFATYYFVALSASGKIFRSRQFYHHVNMGVNLGIVYKSIGLFDSSSVYLSAEIMNYGDETASTVPVLFEEYQTASASWTSVGRDTIAVPAYRSTVAKVRYWPQPGNINIRVIVDPENVTGDIDPYNNKATQAIHPHLFEYRSAQGVVARNQTLPLLNIDDVLTLRVPAGVVPSNNDVLQVRQVRTTQVHQQPGFSPSHLFSAYEIDFSSHPDKFTVPIQLSVSTKELSDEQKDDLNLTFCRFNEKIQKWIRLPTETDTKITTQTLHSGLFALFRIDDTTPPSVELAIDGNAYVPDIYVAANAQLSVSLQDENGIDISSPHFSILLDDRKLPQEELALPDSIGDGNHVTLNIMTNLSSGTHVMSITAADCNGNVSDTKEYSFIVTKDFEVKVLGNYPNPFKRETTFAYLLTQPADRVSIKIYTASGRLIRNLNPGEGEDANPLAPDYHELRWDGTDDDGHEVANGVYFYKFIATSLNSTKEITGKIARIR